MERKNLTAAEQQRLRAFENTKQALEEKGYKARNLTMTALSANLLALPIMLPFCVLVFFLFFLTASNISYGFSGWGYMLTLISSVFLHEWIHGITWSRFSPNGKKDIEFGFIWAALTPYCTCRAPLTRNQYLLGSAMPTVVLGTFLTAAAVVTGKFWLLLASLIMVIGGGGDAAIILKILRDHPKKDALYHDHPTEVGVVVFERETE